MGEIKWHYVPACNKFAFYDTGSGYRVVDRQTGEIMLDGASHDDAFTWILRAEYPVGTKYPALHRVA